MPLPTINHVVRAAVRGTCAGGGRWVNVLHFNFSAGGWPAAGDIAALDGKLVKLYNVDYAASNAYLRECVAATTLDDVTYTPLDGTSASTIVTHGLAGSSAGNSNPAEVSWVLTLRTLTRGRSYRGRMYLPPFSSAYTASTTGRLAGALITNLVNQAIAFQADIGVSNWSWGIASYKLGLFNTAVSFTMDPIADVQRRRKS